MTTEAKDATYEFRGPVISVKNLEKKFGEHEVLKDISFDLFEGDVVCIIGSSGSGKSTLLRCINHLETPTSGQILYHGYPLTKDAQTINRFRSQVGMVFQQFNLFNNLTVLENVELAAQICKDPLDAATVLNEVGLSARANTFPGQLSGGEQQRVAIARALAKNPKLLLCDEPTGALDYVTGKQILKLLQDTCRQKGVTVVVITHNSAITPMADRVIHIKNGTVESMQCNEHPTSVELIEW